MFTYGSICSGIEAASVAWKGLGEPLWFSEIEPFPCAVLAHHYPDIPNLGDMTALPEKILNREIPAPDVLVGGTPCFTAGHTRVGKRTGCAIHKGQRIRTLFGWTGSRNRAVTTDRETMDKRWLCAWKKNRCMANPRCSTFRSRPTAQKSVCCGKC